MFTAFFVAFALASAGPPPQPAAERPIAQYLERADFAAIPNTRSPVQAKTRDSIKNGAIIGAIVGGIVTGAGIGLLCHAFNDTDEPQCWKATLLWGGIGAAGGAAAGAGVDALFWKRTTITASVRF